MNIDQILKQVLNQNGSAFFYTPALFKGSKSYLFSKPSKIFNSQSCKSLKSKLINFENSITNKSHGYCLLNYEAGFCFEAKLKPHLKKKTQLFKGLIFNHNNYREFRSSEILIPPLEKNFKVSSFHLETSRAKYLSDIKKIKDYISEGDTYQVNYTVKGRFKFVGDITNLFKYLIFNQTAGYIALINSGDKIIISISPELFFELKDVKIITRPMKGTISRGFNIEDDNKKIARLYNSKKDIAENVMIVDLLRNDLGRICQFGTVKTTKLFNIEKYETLFQMVSTVTGRIKKGIHLSDVIQNIFPCGSITGAPKFRTMEIIKKMESRNRGIYTGSIGIVNRNKSVFNVAIRTLEIDKAGNGEIGLGSGIVWDSNPADEYKETMLKSSFLTQPVDEFCLFETMRFENGAIKDFTSHLNRLKISADYFSFYFNEKAIIKRTNLLLSNLDRDKMKKIKILITKQGEFDINISDFPVIPNKISIRFSSKRISSTNKFQYFKTTNRELYDAQWNKFSKKGFFDVLFLNERDEVTEGAISNIFIRKGKYFYTPPITSGILNGIERNNFIKSNPNVKEKTLYIKDIKLADEIILTNSLRGITKVNSVVF